MSEIDDLIAQQSSNGWNPPDLNQLFVGNTQGAHLYVGDQIPNVLLSAYNGEVQWKYVQLFFYEDGVSFFYIGLGFNSFFNLDEVLIGTYDTTNGVVPILFIDGPGLGSTAGAVHMGSDRYNGALPVGDNVRPSIDFRTADFQITSTGTSIFNNTPLFSNAIDLRRVSASNVVLLSRQDTGSVADALARYSMTAGGLMQWGDGTNARDTSLYRAGVGELGSDPILFNNGGVGEDWIAVSGLSNGWTNADYTFAYRRVPGLANDLEIKLAITPGTKTDNTTIVTLPAGYRPASKKFVSPAYNGSSVAAGSPRLELTTGGALNCVNCGSVTFLAWQGVLSLV